MWLIVGGIAVSVAVLGLIGFIAKRALDRVVKK
jgi:nitrate reductase gamma subunit